MSGKFKPSSRNHVRVQQLRAREVDVHRKLLAAGELRMPVLELLARGAKVLRLAVGDPLPAGAREAALGREAQPEGGQLLRVLFGRA